MTSKRKEGLTDNAKTRKKREELSISATKSIKKEDVEITGHEFQKLPYSYNFLEPIIDAETMKIHHTKHQKKSFELFLKIHFSKCLKFVPLSITNRLLKPQSSTKGGGGNCGI